MGKRWIGVLLLGALTVGCSAVDKANTERGRGDAPVGRVDNSPKEVIQMPDRFSNVATACDGHGHRIFVTTQTDSGRFLSVVSDEGCGNG